MSEAPVRRVPVVWVVDDSPMERTITIHSLGEGYGFTEFADGAEVVEALQAGRSLPDVVLLDWTMPGMSGDEVTRFLRSQPRTRDLPIILVTASRVETGDVVEGLSLGANDYVARPFAPEELRARINAILRTKQLNDAASRERMRLAAINRLGRKLFEAGSNVPKILEELADTLTATLCDGCAVLLLPGAFPAAAVNRHHGDPSAELLASISTVADPTTFSFESSSEALSKLPPAYHPYIHRFGLRGLAILPFPIRAPVEGVVTITRDGASSPLDADDISTIETCIEYASLAVQNAMRFDAERGARAKLDAVVASAPIGIVVMGPTGDVTLANPAAAKLIPGIDRAEGFIDTFRLARWTDIDGTPVDEAEWLRGRIAGSRVASSHERVIHPLDGSPPRTLSISRVPLFTGTELIGDVTTIEDVTAAREIARERERGAKFQEQMLGIVGHDLRNPLGALFAGIEAIEIRAGHVEAIPSIIRRMQSSGARMNRIVDQLLDVTRARLGTGIPIARREAELTPMIRHVLDELAASYPKATFQLVAAEEVVGHWDVDRLSQVVANLAGNAAQYGLVTEPIVVGLSASEEKATLTVTNVVRDKPIDPDRLGVIFDPYERGRDTHSNASGLGLGLYIVSEIVRAHQGTIQALSEGTHTVFRVDLPRQLPAT